MRVSLRVLLSGMEIRDETVYESRGEQVQRIRSVSVIIITDEAKKGLDKEPYRFKTNFHLEF